MIESLRYVGLVRLPRVYHVGTFKPDDKLKGAGASHEGNGLSVTLHPDEWTRIARLGDDPVWSLTKPGGFRFLNFRALRAADVAALSTWAVDAGWLKADGHRWQVSWTDTETGDSRSMLVDTERKAVDEAEDMPSDAHASVKAVLCDEATAAMNARIGFVVNPGLAIDMAATIYAEDVAMLDGVWWEDRLDVACLSAPRGVINLRSLPDVTRRMREVPSAASAVRRARR